MESKIFTKAHLVDVVKLAPKHAGPKFQDVICEKLTEKLEGICTHHGYIKKGSINILKIMPGRIENVALNGNIMYNVAFTAEICNPLVGSIIRCRVANTNKFGILADAGFYNNTDYVNVLEVIVAKNSVNMVSDIDLEKIAIDDTILVEVMGKKYQLNDTKISIVGRVVNDEKKKTVAAQPVAGIVEDIEAEEEVVEAEEEDVDADADAADADADAADEADDEIKSQKGGAFFSDGEESEAFSVGGDGSVEGGEGSDGSSGDASDI